MTIQSLQLHYIMVRTTQYAKRYEISLSTSLLSHIVALGQRNVHASSHLPYPGPKRASSKLKDDKLRPYDPPARRSVKVTTTVATRTINATVTKGSSKVSDFTKTLLQSEPLTAEELEMYGPFLAKEPSKEPPKTKNGKLV